MKLLGALTLLILVLTLEVGTVIPSMLTISDDGNAGPVFFDYVLPDGDLWTSQDFPVQVWVSDADVVDTVYLLMLENNTWVKFLLFLLDRWTLDSNVTTGLYGRFLPIAVPAPGLVVNYTFRFKGNDTLGNVAITHNITTSVYRGEGPLFVGYSIPDQGWGDWMHCSVMVYDADGIDTVQLHVWDPHTGVWSTEVMLPGENPWGEIGENYYCYYSVDAPWDEPPHVYKFRLEANDTLGNSVVSCEMSRVYYEIITDGRTTADAGLPATLEALAVLLAAGCTAAIVILRARRRP